MPKGTPKVINLAIPPEPTKGMPSETPLAAKVSFALDRSLLRLTATSGLEGARITKSDILLVLLYKGLQGLKKPITATLVKEARENIETLAGEKSKV